MQCQADFADGTVVKEISKPEIYVIFGGKRMLIDDGKTIFLRSVMGLDWVVPRFVSDGTLTSIPILKLESATETPPSLVFPPDNQGGKFNLGINGSTRLVSQGKEIRIIELRGWLRSIDGECNGLDPDWHYMLEVDAEWAVSKGIDLNQILKVGNIITKDFLVRKHDPQTRTYSPNATLAQPCIEIELNRWRDNNEALKRFNEPRQGSQKYHFTTVQKPLDWNDSVTYDSLSQIVMVRCGLLILYIQYI